MSRFRILTFLGPLFVTYLLGHVLYARPDVSWAARLAPWTLALLASCTPFFLRAAPPAARAERVAALGATVAVASALFELATSAFYGSFLFIAAVSVASGLVLDLALDAALPGAAAVRRRMLRLVPIALSIAVAALASSSILPPIPWADRQILVPARLADLPLLYLLLALVVALGLRGLARRLGSAPEVQADNAWALVGVIAALASAAIVFLLGGPTSQPRTAAVLAAGGAALVFGHVAMIDPRLRAIAGPSTRRLLAGGITLMVMAAVAVQWWTLAEERASQALAAAAFLLLSGGVHVGVTGVVEGVFAPFRGRLLEAIGHALRELRTAATLEDLARVVLGAIRSGTADPTCTPVLHLLDPPLRLAIDGAGIARVTNGRLPEAVARELSEQPRRVLVRSALEAQIVRRPDQRPVIEWLLAEDALCIVPLALEGELEGAITIPRGARGRPLAFEELCALEELGRAVSAQSSLLAGAQRAARRVSDATTRQRDLEEQVEVLEEALERARTDAHALFAGAAADRLRAPVIAYSPATRRLQAELRRVSPLDAPLLLIAEGGTPVETLAHEVHRESSRRARAFVVADCAAVRPEESLVTLLGDRGEEGRPGWLRLAEGGTLLVKDVPALPAEAQHALVEALATRQANTLGGDASYPVDVRIIATARVGLTPLTAAGVFDPELARWLEPFTLEVPPLRERKEDLRSLVLLAIDRACRVSGHAVVGIEEDAMGRLLGHDWPGNLRELDSVVDRAVARCRGRRIESADLPPFSTVAIDDSRAERDDALAGTYASIERRVLANALVRARGNKTAAARILGLKRSTFLDKLRRYEIVTTDEQNLAS